MYRNNSLIPSEAVRLAALGSLWQGAKRYADLATELRHFTGRIVGPSLELLGPSLEVLRLEGLIEAEPGTGEGPSAVMAITEAGRQELHRLMTASLRGPLGEINKLLIALKMRFMNALAPEERRLQADLLSEICEQELARLNDLRAHHADEPGHLLDWLDHDISQIEARLAWFRALRERL